MIRIKGSHYPKDVTLYAVFFYMRHAVNFGRKTSCHPAKTQPKSISDTML